MDNKCSLKFHILFSDRYVPFFLCFPDLLLHFFQLLLNRYSCLLPNQLLCFCLILRFIQGRNDIAKKNLRCFLKSGNNRIYNFGSNRFATVTELYLYTIIDIEFRPLCVNMLTVLNIKSAVIMFGIISPMLSRLSIMSCCFHSTLPFFFSTKKDQVNLPTQSVNNNNI